MKYKIFAVLLFVTLMPLGIKHRLIIYIAEETLAVVSVVAFGVIILLLVRILVALSLEGLRTGFCYMADKFRGMAETPGNRLTTAKPLRSIEHEPSKDGISGSRNSPLRTHV